MNLFLVCFTSGASFLLSFLLFFHPLQQNVKANRWLGFFVFTISCAFTGIYMIKTETDISDSCLFKCLNSVQFLLAPSFFISILYFVKPAKRWRKADWLHFIPFIIYVYAENIWQFGKESISTISLFAINKNVSFLVRDILPFLTLFYLVKSYIVLIRHKANLKLVSSSIDQINLDWLVQFLFILSLTVIIWINDALFELPLLTEATPFVYAGAIFFLAWFSIKQKTIFAFKEKDIGEISDILEIENHKTEMKESSFAKAAKDEDSKKDDIEVLLETKTGKSKQKRFSEEQIADLSGKLLSLMESEKLFLDNDLTLPTVAERLGISIHETSFLINETTKDNFYNFINKYRIDEAKKLLTSSKMDELNILGIAFASGFNSKTTFNTAFKKWVGVSPTNYVKKRKNQ